MSHDRNHARYIGQEKRHHLCTERRRPQPPKNTHNFSRAYWREWPLPGAASPNHEGTFWPGKKRGPPSDVDPLVWGENRYPSVCPSLHQTAALPQGRSTPTTAFHSEQLIIIKLVTVITAAEHIDPVFHGIYVISEVQKDPTVGSSAELLATATAKLGRKVEGPVAEPEALLTRFNPRNYKQRPI